MEKTIAGKTVDVNEEGYLTDASQWTEGIAEALAIEEEIGPLTDAHWRVIRLLREKHEAGEGVSIRRLNKTGLVPTRQLYALFPKGPLKTAARIAGVPKPASCI